MIDREVTQISKDKNGDLTALCNPNTLWSPKLKSMAILEIENNTHRYFISNENEELDIHVVRNSLNGKSLMTDRNSLKTKNLLYDLPPGQLLSKSEEEISKLL